MEIFQTVPQRQNMAIIDDGLDEPTTTTLSAVRQVLLNALQTNFMSLNFLIVKNKSKQHQNTHIYG